MSPPSAAKAARLSGVSPARASGRLLRSSAALASSSSTTKTTPTGKKRNPAKARKLPEEEPMDEDETDGESVVDPNDTPYKGRATGSRITQKRSTSAAIAKCGKSKGVPVQKTAGDNDGSDSDVVEIESPSPAAKGSAKCATKAASKKALPAKPTTRTLRSRKKVLTPSMVLDEEDKSAPTSKGKGKKRAASPIIVDSDEDDVTLSRLKKRRVEESGQEDSEDSDGEAEDGKELDPDQYDCTDPFIDDTAIDSDGENEEDEAAEDDDDGESHFDDGIKDPLQLLEEEREIRRQRKAAQISLDESLARDIASEDEEGLVDGIVREQIRDASCVRVRASAPERPQVTPVTPSRKGGTTTAAVATGSKSDGTSLKSPFTPKAKGRAFGDVVETPTGRGKSQATPRVSTLDDLCTYRVTSLPDKCQVTDLNLQDSKLREFYVGLAHLLSGVLDPWNDFTGPGMIMFSRWADICSKMSYDSCLSAINFVSHLFYINPSRESPLNVCVKEILGSRPKYHLYSDTNTPAVCISSVFCVESHVLAPPEKGLKQKWMSGIFHSQEWERFVGFMATVFGHERMNAQLSKDAIQFTTKAFFGKGRDFNRNDARMASLFSNIRSPSIKGKGAAEPVVSSDTFTLDFNAEIPVYDGTNVEIDFASDIDRVEFLPKWEGEIPYAAFVVVAYTVAVFKAEKSGAWTISLNIQWAVVMGVPDE